MALRGRTSAESGTVEMIKRVRKMRKAGETVPQIMRQTMLSEASVYRALG